MRRLLIIAIFLSLAIGGQSTAESQPPSPGPTKIGQPPQQQSKGKQSESPNFQRGTKESPVFIETLERQVDRANKIEERKYHDNETTINWRLMFFTGGLLIVAICQIILFYRQLKLMRDSLTVSYNAAITAQESADAALQSATANKLATRAYVRISSCSPGIDLRKHSDPYPHAAVVSNLKIQNYGETPANITKIVIKTCIEETYTRLPVPPDYSTRTKFPFSHAFLVRGESIFYKFADETLLREDDIANIESKKNTLYLYGYVDYTDAFDKRHRGGFGYSYYPPYDDDKNYGDKTVSFKDRNNLVFLMQDGYNYDDERPSEGEPA